MELKKGFKQTDIGVIPEDWQLMSVNEAFEVCNQNRFPINDATRNEIQGDYPYYGPTKIQDYINYFSYEGEYALIGEDGDHFLKWQDFSMTQLTTGKFNVNNHAHVIKGKLGLTLTSWFYYFFRNRDITNYLTRQGAGRYKLTKKTLMILPCLVPPSIQEQTAIATALSDVDALINNLEKLLTKKRNIKQGAMQQLLQPKEGWEVKKLGEIAEFYSGGTPSTSNLSYYGGEISWITSSDLNKNKIFEVDGRITNEGLKNSSAKIVKKGTLLLALYGATAGVIAITYIEGAINQAVLAIIPKTYNSEYLFHLLSSLKSWIVKTYTQGGQANLSGNIIKSIELSFPPIKEQIQIATILSDMDAEITALETKLAKYQQLKQGMMQNLLTGKIRLL